MQGDLWKTLPSQRSLSGAIGSNRQSYREHRQPIGSHREQRQSYRKHRQAYREPSGATNRVIGSYREAEHRQIYREPSGAQTELSGVIELIKPMYACFKTHIYAFTAIRATMPKEYSIGGQNYAYMCLTLSEAQMEAKACTYALYNKQRQKDLYMYAFTHRRKNTVIWHLTLSEGNRRPRHIYIYIYSKHTIGEKFRHIGDIANRWMCHH